MFDIIHKRHAQKHEERRETGREEGRNMVKWLVSSFSEYPRASWSSWSREHGDAGWLSAWRDG